MSKKNINESIRDAWQKSLQNGETIRSIKQKEKAQLDSIVEETRNDVLSHLAESDKGFYRPETSPYHKFRDGDYLRRQRLIEETEEERKKREAAEKAAADKAAEENPATGAESEAGEPPELLKRPEERKPGEPPELLKRPEERKPGEPPELLKRPEDAPDEQPADPISGAEEPEATDPEATDPEATPDAEATEPNQKRRKPTFSGLSQEDLDFKIDTQKLNLDGASPRMKKMIQKRILNLQRAKAKLAGRQSEFDAADAAPTDTDAAPTTATDATATDAAATDATATDAATTDAATTDGTDKNETLGTQAGRATGEVASKYGGMGAEQVHDFFSGLFGGPSYQERMSGEKFEMSPEGEFSGPGAEDKGPSIQGVADWMMNVDGTRKQAVGDMKRNETRLAQMKTQQVEAGAKLEGRPSVPEGDNPFENESYKEWFSSLDAKKAKQEMAYQESEAKKQPIAAQVQADNAQSGENIETTQSGEEYDATKPPVGTSQPPSSPPREREQLDASYNPIHKYGINLFEAKGPFRR